MDSFNEAAVSTFPVPLPQGEHHLLISENTYIATQYGCEGFLYMGRSPRVAVWFEIHGAGIDKALIAAYYNVNAITKCGEKVRGRARDPEFDAGWKSRIVRDIATLFPDRYSPSELPKCVPVMPHRVHIKTFNVKHDPDGTPRPKPFWYSKVHHIMGWANE